MPKLVFMISAYSRALGRLVQNIEAGVSMDTIGLSLAAAVRRSRPRNVDIIVVDGALHVDGTAVDGTEAPEVVALLDVFARHGMTGVSIRMGTTPRELLQLAAQ